MSYPPPPPPPPGGGDPGNQPTQAFPPQATPPPGGGFPPPGFPPPGGFPPPPGGGFPPPGGGFPPPGGGFNPPPPAKKKGMGSGAIIGIAAIVIVAILAAGVGVFLVIGGDDDDKRTSGGGETTTTEDETTTTEETTTTATTTTTTTTTETMTGTESVQTGSIPLGGSYLLEVEVGSLGATLTVAPDNDSWDLVLIVNGGGFVDEEIDQSFDEEEVEFQPGTYTVEVRGYQDLEFGSFTATLA